MVGAEPALGPWHTPASSLIGEGYPPIRLQPDPGDEVCKERMGSRCMADLQAALDLVCKVY
eukprot:1153959-Pelagomonas_calceolata.AAC.5